MFLIVVLILSSSVTVCRVAVWHVDTMHVWPYSSLIFEKLCAFYNYRLSWLLCTGGSTVSFMLRFWFSPRHALQGISYTLKVQIWPINLLWLLIFILMKMLVLWLLHTIFDKWWPCNHACACSAGWCIFQYHSWAGYTMVMYIFLTVTMQLLLKWCTIINHNIMTGGFVGALM